MFTQVTSIEELKEIFLEMLLNTTDKLTKISPGSVNDGFAYGIAKLGQKTLKEIALVESHIFIDSAFGPYLDSYASKHGFYGRFSSNKSTTYVRVVGDVGTSYQIGVHTITGNHGIIFDLQENITIGSDGFAYVKVRSQTSGSVTNVESFTLNKISPAPVGHKYCINEMSAIGGRDNEDDDTFRQRLKEGVNIAARETLSMLDQLFNLINNNVLKTYHNGLDLNGNVVLRILSQNGADFTSNELNDLLLQGKKYFSLTEIKPDETAGYGVVLQNPSWQLIDVSVRLEVEDSYNIDDVRKEIQIRLNKVVDYRYFTATKLEWDDLFVAVKQTPGVKYIYDNFFYPRTDIMIDRYKLPRIRGFLMLDKNGLVLSGNQNTIDPIFYPFQADFAYQYTLFKSLVS